MGERSIGAAPIQTIDASLGETHISVKVRAIAGSRHEEVRLPVDTGATYSWISRRALEKIGAKPARRTRFKTMGGEIVEREVGYVLVEYDDEEAPTTAVFAGDMDGNVFGLHGLESLGLEVDPTTQQVRKSEALLAL